MDFAILDWIQENMRSELMDSLMVAISFLGNAGWIWIVIAVIMLAWKSHRACGTRMAIGLISSLLIGNLFLKHVVARPRPCWINDAVQLLVTSPNDYSFPSGHTLASFISATILFQYNRGWGTVAYILAIIIAFSRLYLYVHFPTDVLVGAILGIAIGIIVYKAVDNIEPNIHSKTGSKTL